MCVALVACTEDGGGSDGADDSMLTTDGTATGSSTDPAGSSTGNADDDTTPPGSGTSAADDSPGSDDPAGDDASNADDPAGDDLSTTDDTGLADDSTPDDTASPDDATPDDDVLDDAMPDDSMTDESAPGDDPSDDSSPDDGMADDGMGGAGNDDAGGSGGDSPDAGPVEGAYVPCSGTPFPEITLTQVLEGIDEPVSAVTPAGDSSTMFVAELSGDLLRFDLSQPDPSPTTILTVNAATGAECGFYAVALHPNFDGVAEQRIYVSYAGGCAPIFGGGGDPGSGLVDEYIVDGDAATFSQNVLTVTQPEGNHNGGSLLFGPDGYLYHGLGDGGGSNDAHGQNGNGQDPNTALGSLLRIDVDDIDTAPDGNLTSADVGGASVDSRIKHFGLRNPWRFSFDRETGDLYIGDVGQNTWEEISFAPADSAPLNFGWAAREGLVACPTCSNKTLLSGSSATDPIFVYPRGSVTGGFVYRGRNIPGMIGRYIFADYSSGQSYSITYDGQGGACDVEEGVLGNITNNSLASFAEDSDGELYVLNLSRGTIHRIDPM